jgi:hypothetical protein
MKEKNTLNNRTRQERPSKNVMNVEKYVTSVENTIDTYKGELLWRQLNILGFEKIHNLTASTEEEFKEQITLVLRNKNVFEFTREEESNEILLEEYLIRNTFKNRGVIREHGGVWINGAYQTKIYKIQDPAAFLTSDTKAFLMAMGKTFKDGAALPANLGLYIDIEYLHLPRYILRAFLLEGILNLTQLQEKMKGISIKMTTKETVRKTIGAGFEKHTLKNLKKLIDNQIDKNEQ